MTLTLDLLISKAQRSYIVLRYPEMFKINHKQRRNACPGREVLLKSMKQPQAPRWFRTTLFMKGKTTLIVCDPWVVMMWPVYDESAANDATFRRSCTNDVAGPLEHASESHRSQVKAGQLQHRPCFLRTSSLAACTLGVIWNASL